MCCQQNQSALIAMTHNYVSGIVFRFPSFLLIPECVPIIGALTTLLLLIKLHNLLKYQLIEDMAQDRKYWMANIMAGPAQGDGQERWEH